LPANDLETTLAKVLTDREKRSIEPGKLVRAGVLVPLLKRTDDYCLLFTRRPKELKNHPGQISFPGGLFEEKDLTLERTAIREAWEELGIYEKDIQILGPLDDYPSTTGYLISPFVGKIPYPYDFKINRREISEVIIIRIEEFKRLPRTGYVVREGEPYPVYYYDLQNHVVWGATARIVKNLIETLFPNQTSRV
jgi:8-oxo-dGTP pyrophosphatase MutT (NUDIX family)